MKTINLCLVFISLLALIGCNAKQGYVAKGNKLYEEGKYAEASLNYRKAIQKDPQYGEAYYRLGLSAIKQNEARLAYDALLRAVQLVPDNRDAKEKFADICLAYYLVDPRHPQIYYNLLIRYSGELLAKNPRSFEGLKVKAYLASTERKPQEAIALFRKALEVDGSDAAMRTALVQELFRNNQPQEAENLARDVIARQKTYGPIYDILYQRYLTTNRPGDAENILKLKVNNNPKNAGIVLELAAHYARQQQQTQMKATLQRMLDNRKDFPNGWLSVGDFYAGLRDYAGAVRYYQDGMTQDPKNKVIYQIHATNALIAQGKNDEAFQTVEQIVKEKPKEIEARRIRANLLLRRGKPADVEQAEGEFLALAKETPNDAGVWFGLGEARRLKGDFEGARTQYLESLKREKNYLPARYGLAETGLMNQRTQEALQQANEILKVRSSDPEARLLHARALLATGSLAAARDELDALAKAAPHDPRVQVELGLVALSERKYAEARSVFVKLQNSGDPQAIAGLSETYLMEKQFEKAFALLQDGLKQSPNSAFIQEQFAKAAALTGRYDLAITEYQKVISANPASKGARSRLAEVYELKGDYDNAIATYQKAEQLSPTDPQLGVELAAALAKGGRTNEAKAQYEKMIRSNPDNPGILNDAAFFLSDSGGDLDEALKLAERALEKAPAQPGFSDTIGYIYLKKGQRDSAIQTFSNLSRKYPGYPTFRYHLGLALLDKGDKLGAKKEFQAALANHPTQRDAQRIRELLEKIG